MCIRIRQKTYKGTESSSLSSSHGNKSSPTHKTDPNEMKGFSEWPIHFAKSRNGLTFSSLVVLAFLETLAAWGLQMLQKKGTYFIVFLFFLWTSVAESCCHLLLDAGSSSSWGGPSLLCLCGIEGSTQGMTGQRDDDSGDESRRFWCSLTLFTMWLCVTSSTYRARLHKH